MERAFAVISISVYAISTITSSVASSEWLAQWNVTQSIEQDATLLHVLSNLTTQEYKLLDTYRRQRAYSKLKAMIDDKRNEIWQSADGERTAEWVDGANDTELLINALNVTQTQLEIIEAYQNASIYQTIRALWNSKVETVLPQIDQHAILEYYEEKLAEKAARENFITRLWNLIKQWFRPAGDDPLAECTANEPECIRAAMSMMSAEERAQLEDAAQAQNHTEIARLIERKLCETPELRDAFRQWIEENHVPDALREIVQNLTQAQARSMENLRKLELTNAIKDYYRGMIEKRSPDEQLEIEGFFQRMNKTFARCYKPSNFEVMQ